MIYDGLNISKQQSNFSDKHLEYKAYYPESRTYSYKLNGTKPLKVYHNTIYNELKISGSFPYFWQGHNLTYSTKDFRNTIESIEDALSCNLMDAKINSIEFNAVMQLPKQITMKKILETHSAPKGYSSSIYDNGTQFKKGFHTTKLYDVSVRLKQNTSSTLRKELTQKGLYQPTEKNYIKLENAYSRFGNQNKEVKDLFSNQFIEYCEQNLIYTYKSLKKTKGFKGFSNKKEADVSNILLEYILRHQKAPGALDTILESINEVEVLNKHDIKYRRSQVRERFKRMQSGQALLDLETYLVNAFNYN